MYPARRDMRLDRGLGAERRPRQMICHGNTRQNDREGSRSSCEVRRVCQLSAKFLMSPERGNRVIWGKGGRGQLVILAPGWLWRWGQAPVVRRAPPTKNSTAHPPGHNVCRNR